jgi:hypothetical protein
LGFRYYLLSMLTGTARGFPCDHKSSFQSP